MSVRQITGTSRVSLNNWELLCLPTRAGDCHDTSFSKEEIRTAIYDDTETIGSPDMTIDDHFEESDQTRTRQRKINRLSRAFYFLR